MGRWMKSKHVILIVAAIGAALLIWQWSIPNEAGIGQKLIVRVPELSELAGRGKTAFEANCAACHGVNGAGTDQGPPLVHDIYNPGHHADGAFFFAATRGVRQHHWRFGNMPPQPQVSQGQLAAIVRYVRELQVANGITYRPHQM